MYPPHQHYPPMDRKTSNRNIQEAATQRKAANDTQYFWDLVHRNMSGHGVAQRKVNKAQEEHMLFSKKAETAVQGTIDDNIPVQRSGPKSDEVQAIETFQQLQDQVPSSILKCVEMLRFDKPTPIQKHAVPLGLAGLDLMCCAQTGSGKTIAFLIPVITSLDPTFVKSGGSEGEQHPQQPVQRVSVDERGVLPKAVVLAPTRELASQIQLDARRLTFGSNIRSVCVYGGNDIRSQLVELCTGCELIVATPGRLNDLVDRGVVSLSQVNFLVLDEADRMLDMGFEPQIRKIVLDYDMPRGEDRQTFLFSATFPNEIQTLAREFLRNYVWIAVGRVGSTVENIKQQVLLASADPNEKIKLLLSVLGHTDGRTLIFVQKKKTASWLCDCLRNGYGVSVEEIHGDRSQAQRENALKLFRDGQIRILVATDVAARGLDVPAVTHVIQFDMPLSAEDFDVYVHRIGRTGRAGQSGLATSFFVPGREVGEGNGKIAPLLYHLLKENNQEIPEWFQNCEDLQSHGHHGASHQRKYNANGQGYSQQSRPQQQSRFGFHDARSNQQNVTYQSNNNPHSNGHNNYDNQRGFSQQRNGGYGQSYGSSSMPSQSQYGNSRPQPYQRQMQPQHQSQPPHVIPQAPTMTPPSQPPMHAAAPYNMHPQSQQYYPSQQYPSVPPVQGTASSTGVPPSSYPVPPPANNLPQIAAPTPQHQQPPAYAVQAPPAMMTPPVPPTTAPYQPTGGYYDPYSGTYVPGTGNVEAMTNQFGAMNMQQPPQQHQQQQWMPQQGNMQMGGHGHVDDRRRQGYGQGQGNHGGRNGMQQGGRPNNNMQPPHQHQMYPPNMQMNYPQQQMDSRMYNGGRPQYVQHTPMPYGRPQYGQEQVPYQQQHYGGTTYYPTDSSVPKVGENGGGEEPITSDA